MPVMPLRRYGFTLVELVVVIMLLGILSLGTVRFISDASDGFVSGSNRGALSADVRQSVHHLGQVLREALPNSIRVSASGECIEYIPIISASVYVSAPIGISGNTMQVIPFDPALTASNWRVAIVPSSNMYGLSTPGAVSPTASASAADVNNIVTLTFSSAHRFASASAQQRFFVVGDPVSYCLSGTTLYRYADYGYQSTQPLVASLPSSLPSRSVVVDGVAAALPIFATDSAALTRNAVVTIDLALQKGADQLPISHSVQIRNQI